MFLVKRSVLRSLLNTKPLLQYKLPENYRYGKGGEVDKVPSNLEQATGIERIEMMHHLQGEDPFDMSVTTLKNKGTFKNPIIVKSLGMSDRVVGCKGVGEEAHDINWILLEKRDVGRCGECGNAFQLDEEMGQDDYGH